jgi:hypothetical protein
VARAFATSDYADEAKTGTVAADGTALVTFGPVDASKLWRITRAVVGAQGSTLVGPALLYVGDTLPQNLRDGTSTGTFDIAEYPAPLVVPATEVLNVAWSGMTPGATVNAAIQYEELEEFGVPGSVPGRLA